MKARAEPEVLAKKTLKQVVDHTTEIINGLDKKPALIGHSTGGFAGEDARRSRPRGGDGGDRPRRLPRRAAAAGVGAEGGGPVPGSTRVRAITLSFDQFKYGWANALDEQEPKELYDSFHVAGSGIALAQMGNANLNPGTDAKVNTTSSDRGPLVIIDGEHDHTVPWAIANAAYKRQQRNPAVTEIVKMPNRGHSLTIDDGCREVAQTAVDFVKRFA